MPDKLWACRLPNEGDGHAVWDLARCPAIHSEFSDRGSMPAPPHQAPTEARAPRLGGVLMILDVLFALGLLLTPASQLRFAGSDT